MQNFSEFTNLNSSKLQWPQEILKRSIDCKHFKIEPEKWFFFAIFLVGTWFLRSMGAVAQNRLIPQKCHKNRNCGVSKSKIIMGLWFLALKARMAGNWPRTFYTGLTVCLIVDFYHHFQMLQHTLLQGRKILSPLKYLILLLKHIKDLQNHRSSLL